MAPRSWNRSRLRAAFTALAVVAAGMAAASPVLASPDDPGPGCTGAGGAACPVAGDAGVSWLPHLSADGRYVAFYSEHDLTHDGASNGIFRFDRVTGTVARADLDEAGRPNTRGIFECDISADGDRVVFAAIPPDSPVGTDHRQIYVHQFSTGRTALASANTGGRPSTGWIGEWPTISPDGRFVAFGAQSGDLVAGDRPDAMSSEAYVRDLTLNKTTRVSVGPGGLSQITDTNGSIPLVSAGGRYVAFDDGAKLTTDDTDNAQDVYVRDMQTGLNELVSLDPSGQPMPGSGLQGMSADGTLVLFIGADTGGTGAAIYLRDRVARTSRRLFVLNATGPQFGRRATISGDGSVVALQTSTPVGSDDHDGRDDVVLIDTRTGAVRPTTPDGMADPPDAQVVDPVLSFDGSLLAVDSAWRHTDSTTPNTNADLDTSEIYVFDAQTGAWEQITPGHNSGPAPPVEPPLPAAVDTAPAPAAGGGTTPASAGPAPMAAADTSGYWMVSDAGEVYGFGAAARYGNGGAQTVDLEPTPAMDGYWTLDRSGHVTPQGRAAPLGSATLRAGEHATSLSATRSGRGYWIFTDTGRVVTIGDAAFFGDMSKTRLNGPVLDSVVTPSGQGYWMVASDGGIFSFGDARFSGSMGGRPLNQPIASMAPDPDGAGYWLVASDGGIFAFDAAFHGSMGGVRLNKPVTGMVPGPGGYLMVATDGGIFAFGDVPFHGSLGATPPPRPVVAVALKR